MNYEAARKIAPDLDDTTLQRIHDALNTPEPEREPGYYWVRTGSGRSSIFYWSGNGHWSLFGTTASLADSKATTVLSDRLTPPEPDALPRRGCKAWFPKDMQPIYINDDTYKPYMSDSPQIDWSNVKRWKYATDWKVWNGGPCPVTGKVRIMFRDGSVSIGIYATNCNWFHSVPFMRKEREIVAYKPVT